MSTSSTESSSAATQKHRRPDLETVYSINPDGSRNTIHPADVKGRWQTRVNILWTVLIAVYVVMPWIEVGGHPLIHFDLPGRRAHLFGLSFTNQDFFLLFFVLTGIGYALFVLTALWGRVFCGFACPQTVFMEGIFRRVERLIEGPRNQRLKRDRGPAGFDKVWRKAVKHVLFLVLSALVAHVFLSYFLPARELWAAIWAGPTGHMSAFFWTVFWWAILYFDYSWFREQTCIVICPYGRLQSALVDQDTIVIGYDKQRGEPRGKGKHTGGDCVDCYRCVVVCPTGIDIRNGLQMECIGCTHCIDACDDIMRRVGKPEGLVRFDSLRGFAGEGRRSLLRLRVFIYVLFGVIGLSVALWAASGREAFQANVLRARGLPYVLEENRIRNLFNLHLQNKGSEPTVYVIAVDESAESSFEWILPEGRIMLEGGDNQQWPIFVYLPIEAYDEATPLRLTVTDSTSGEQKVVEMLFRGP
jgi:cytochrome c oxidase accessory protein FixG